MCRVGVSARSVNTDVGCGTVGGTHEAVEAAVLAGVQGASQAICREARRQSCRSYPRATVSRPARPGWIAAARPGRRRPVPRLRTSDGSKNVHGHG